MAASDISSQVAARIRELREARGLSVRALARRSGLPPESISRSERLVTEITLTSLAKLCRGLRVDLPTFFDFGPTAAPEFQDPQLRRLVYLLQDLPPERRSVAVRGLDLLLRALSAAPPHSAETSGELASRSSRRRGR